MPKDVLEEMTFYGGAFREEEIPVKVLILDDWIAGEIDCIECDGTGIWMLLPPDDRPVKYTT